jgi:hypothetical protein
MVLACSSTPVRKYPRRAADKRGEGVESNRERILEDASSLRETMRRIVRYISYATERLDHRIEDGTLDGRTEAKELREALERRLGFEVNEDSPIVMPRYYQATFRKMTTISYATEEEKTVYFLLSLRES